MAFSSEVETGSRKENASKQRTTASVLISIRIERALRRLVAYPRRGVYEFAHGATWRSGYATVCKTVYTSSILVVASISIINVLH